MMPDDYYFVPQELGGHSSLKRVFVDACEALFQGYVRLLDGCIAHLRQTVLQREGERDGAYGMRLRRIATDHCRAVLPAATMTNVGVTANARALEHAISKLLSARLLEEHQLGHEIREQARLITPTLIKYAEKNDFLARASYRQREMVSRVGIEDPSANANGSLTKNRAPEVRLVDYDDQATEKLATVLLYGGSHLTYDEVWQRVQELSEDARQEIIDESLSGLGPHDAPARELEVIDYTFEYLMDYGAYREFKRHRMQSYLPQPLTVANGYRVPSVVEEAGMAGEFEDALALAERAFWKVHEQLPWVAQYLVTHAHNRRGLSKLNLRECYHLFKLRTSEMAHFSIREPTEEGLRLAVGVHPQLFRHLRLRNYPEWWPFAVNQ